MSQSQILSLISGASLLPYVYCKKVTLMNGQSDQKLLVTLNLEIYRETNDFIRSSIFNLQQFSFVNRALEDYLYLQVTPLIKTQNVAALRPAGENSIYTAKSSPGYDDFINIVGNYSYLPVGQIYGDFRMPTYGLFADEDTNPPEPVVIGSAVSAFSGPEMVPERQELINGIPYDVITFEYTYEYEMPLNTTGQAIASSLAHLGFVFYCFLDVPQFILQNGGSISGNNSIKIINGPVNTSIVLENGIVPKKIHKFYTIDGEQWNGSVHLHTQDNPDLTDPDNPYFGDGSVGAGKGWMAGERHLPGENQPKLNLIYGPNYMLQDLRSKNIPVQENVLGLNVVDGQRVLNDKTIQNNKLENTIRFFISPFEQESRKYLTKIDFISSRNDPYLGSKDRPIAPNLYDNDSEYSRLYMTKDSAGNASGVFMIDFTKLLINNSNIFSALKRDNHPTENFALFGEYLNNNVINSSELFDIKVYRDRVNKNLIGKVYENYNNDTIYEEPSKLIASRKNNTVISKHIFDNEIKNKQIQCFTFTDLDVSSEESGCYQYRIELLYKDGTYMYLADRLATLKQAYSTMQEYLQLSLTGYSSLEETSLNQTAIGLEEIKRSVYRPYYRDGSFDEQFLIDALNYFNQEEPWDPIHPIQLIFEECAYLLVGAPGEENQYMPEDMLNMFPFINPITGSPQIIEKYLVILSAFIEKIEKLLGLKNKKNHDLTLKINPFKVALKDNTYSVPSNALIREYHTFNHPEEILQVSSDKDIYIDYLHINQSLQNNSPGIINISAFDYENRCFLELAEVSNDLTDPSGDFFGVSTMTLHDPSNVPFLTAGQSEPTDYIGHSLYGFLSPSIIKITNENHISKFLENANYQSPEEAQSTLHMKNYEKVFNSLINYNFSKQIYHDYDSMSNYFFNEKFNNLLPSDVDESYKDIFNSVNITLHNSSYYKDFFSKPAGAISEKLSPENGNLLPSSYTDFSDSNLSSLIGDHFKNMLFNDVNFFQSPSSQHPASREGLEELAGTSEWSLAFYKALPNIYKIAYAAQTSYEPDADFKIKGIFKQANDISQNITGNGYTFFNLNMVSRVEVYDASQINKEQPLKDQNNWRRLRRDDVENAKISNKALLCRIRLYNKDLVQNFEIPIVNSLFFIENLTLASPIYDTPQAPVVILQQNTLQQMKQISNDYHILSSKILQNSKKVKGKQMLSGPAAASQASGISQQQLAAENATTPATQTAMPSTAAPPATSQTATAEAYGTPILDTSTADGGSAGGY